MTKIRLAIIGCRNMGSKHLAVLRENFSEEIEIAGIMNSTPESSRHRAGELGVPFFSCLDEISPDTVDAAIIATPALNHADIAEILLRRGIPCLVEKPLATTLADCDRLIAAAEESGVLLLAGHTENYNPAVTRLRAELTAPLKSIHALRTSRNAENMTGITAVQELMIHDLAIVYSLLGDTPEGVEIHKSPDRSWENHAVVRLNYPSGTVVELEALREAVPVQRFMNLEDVKGNRFHIDFLARSLSKNGTVLIQGGQNLVEEHRHFISCLKGQSSPLTGAREAMAILALCLMAEAQIPQENQ